MYFVYYFIVLIFFMCLFSFLFVIYVLHLLYCFFCFFYVIYIFIFFMFMFFCFFIFCFLYFCSDCLLLLLFLYLYFYDTFLSGRFFVHRFVCLLVTIICSWLSWAITYGTKNTNKKMCAHGNKSKQQQTIIRKTTKNKVGETILLFNTCLLRFLYIYIYFFLSRRFLMVRFSLDCFCTSFLFCLLVKITIL